MADANGSVNSADVNGEAAIAEINSMIALPAPVREKAPLAV